MSRRRWVQLDGELVEVVRDWMPEPKCDYHIMPDIREYTSMIDGSRITSRSQHKAHLRAHGMVEVGNDSSLHAKPRPITPPPGRKEAIIRAVNEVEAKLRRR